MKVRGPGVGEGREVGDGARVGTTAGVSSAGGSVLAAAAGAPWPGLGGAARPQADNAARLNTAAAKHAARRVRRPLVVIVMDERRLPDFDANLGEARVEGIAQTVAQKIEAQDGEHDRHTREEDQMRRGEHLVAFLPQH